MSVALFIWILLKIILIPLWALIGIWIGNTVGISGLIPFALVVGFYQVSDFWNQYLLSKTVRALKRQIDDENLRGEERQRNFRKIRQLEAKRSLFTALPYLFKRAGTKKVPNHSPSSHEEFLDFAPTWIKEHVLRNMARLSWFAFLRLLPPIKVVIKKAVKDDGVFLGLDLGCGYGEFLEMLARWCQKEKLPAIFIGIENQKNLLDIAIERIRNQNNFEVLMHSGEKVNTDALVDIAKSRGPVVYFILGDALNASQLFGPDTITLTQIVHAKHHFETIMDSVGRMSKYWIILEEYRSWHLILQIYILYWFISRVLICEAEDSILAMYTMEEWRARGVKAVDNLYVYVWAMSDSLYSLLKEEGIVK